MFRYWIALLFLLLASPAQAAWREASSKHFLIYSKGSAEELRDFANRLERYDAAMRVMRGVPDEEIGAANRLTVYLVDSVGQVRKLAGDKDRFVAGFYVPRASGSIAILPRRGLGGGGAYDFSVEQVLFHEYAHHFLFNNFSFAYPAWFSEGFAEFYSTARFEKDGGVGLGIPAHHRAYGLVTGKGLTVERLMTLGTEKLDNVQREAIYGRGWLLTHYLSFEPSREGQLSRYLTALNAGKPSMEAAVAAFGDLKKLDAELDRYMMRRTMKYRKVDAAAIRIAPVQLRELTPAENAVMDVKIRSKRGVDSEGAKQLLPLVRKAAAPYPNDPAAQVTLAEAEYDAGNYKEAEAAADRARAADPKQIDALIYKARAQMALAEANAAPDPKQWKEIRRWLIAANRIDPNDPEPLMLFYESFGRAGERPTANAVAGLNQAFALAPQDRSLRMMTARQYLVDGKAAEARSALAPIAFDPHADEAGAFATRAIELIDKSGAAAALKTLDQSGKQASEASGGS